MISRRSVWIAFFGLVLAEIIIGCQGTDPGPSSPVSARATGYGPHGVVPPLTITDPPRTAVTTTQGGKGDMGGAPQSRLTDLPGAHITTTPPVEPKTVAIGAGQESSPAGAADELHNLHDAVMEHAAHLDNYIVRFRRREAVNGKDQPEETICLKYRTEPWSVHMKWLKPDDAQGREVLYVKGRYEGKMHVVIEKSMPLMGGMKRSFDLNDPLVRGKSRHEITEAGIHAFVNRFHGIVTALDHDDKRAGSLVIHGEKKRPEFEKPMLLVEHVMPAGYEPLLPQGGRRFLYFDETEKLPVLVITQDDRGHEVEYYCYDGLQANVKLDEADFNPANMGGGKK